jgi:hypothetical protein
MQLLAAGITVGADTVNFGSFHDDLAASCYDSDQVFVACSGPAFCNRSVDHCRNNTPTHTTKGLPILCVTCDEGTGSEPCGPGCGQRQRNNVFGLPLGRGQPARCAPTRASVAHMSYGDRQVLTSAMLSVLPNCTPPKVSPVALRICVLPALHTTVLRPIEELMERT